ncbi:MAG: acetyltransferase [Bacillota bacterium]
MKVLSGISLPADIGTTSPYPAVIIGAGGHGKEILEIFLMRKHPVLGLIDDNAGMAGGKVLGVPILGGLSWLEENQDKEFACVCAIGNNPVRKHIVERLAGKVRFINAVHPMAFISPSVQIGSGVMIGAGVILNTDVAINNHVIINTGALVSHETVIEDYGNLNPGSVIAGRVHVEEGAYIGAGATVIQNISIGAWSLVGAGATVIRDVPPYAKVTGVPAKPMIPSKPTGG